MTELIEFADWKRPDTDWLADRVQQSIKRYATNHKLLVTEDPEHKIEIERELGRALFHQVHFAAELAEHTA